MRLRSQSGKFIISWSTFPAKVPKARFSQIKSFTFPRQFPIKVSKSTKKGPVKLIKTRTNYEAQIKKIKMLKIWNHSRRKRRTKTKEGRLCAWKSCKCQPSKSRNAGKVFQRNWASVWIKKASTRTTASAFIRIIRLTNSKLSRRRFHSNSRPLNILTNCSRIRWSSGPTEVPNWKNWSRF